MRSIVFRGVGRVKERAQRCEMLPRINTGMYKHWEGQDWWFRGGCLYIGRSKHKCKTAVEESWINWSDWFLAFGDWICISLVHSRWWNYKGFTSFLLSIAILQFVPGECLWDQNHFGQKVSKRLYRFLLFWIVNTESSMANSFVTIFLFSTWKVLIYFTCAVAPVLTFWLMWTFLIF